MFGQIYLGLGAHLGGFSRGGEWANTYGGSFVTGGGVEFGNSKGRLGGYRYQLHENGIGLRVLAGPSYTSHFIRIQDDANQTTNNLRDEYKRGYDRRAGGFGAYGEFGFQYADPDGTFQLYTVMTGSFASTSALNSTQFDLMDVGPVDGNDFSIGGRLGLILNLFRSTSNEKADEIYY